MYGGAFYEKIVNFFMTQSLSYRNQFIDLLFKSMDWFLYDRDLRHERVKGSRMFDRVLTTFLFGLVVSVKAFMMVTDISAQD